MSKIIGDAAAEPLEPRVVLSEVHYAWTGVETLPGYIADYGIPDKIVGVSDNGEYFCSAAASNRDTDDDEPYVVIRGEVRYLRDIDALADAEIAGINSLGVVLAHDTSGDDLGRLFLYDLEDVASTCEYLDQAGLDAPAGFEIADATPRFITDGGGIVLATNVNNRDLGDQWVVRGDRVAYLWFGHAADVNDADWVAGLAGTRATTTGRLCYGVQTRD